MTDLEIKQMREELKKSIVDKSQCMLDAFEIVAYNTEKTIKKTGLTDVSDEFVLTRASMFFGMSMDKVLEEKKEAAREEANRKHIEAQRRQSTHMQMPTQSQVMSMEEIEKMQAENAKRGGVKSPCQERAERDKKIIEAKEAEIKELTESK